MSWIALIGPEIEENLSFHALADAVERRGISRFAVVKARPTAVDP